jgi:hypothetical protein
MTEHPEEFAHAEVADAAPKSKYAEFYFPVQSTPRQRWVRGAFLVLFILCGGAFLYANTVIRSKGTGAGYRTKVGFVQLTLPVSGIRVSDLSGSRFTLVIDGEEFSVDLTGQPSLVSIIGECRQQLKRADRPSASFAQGIDRHLLLVPLPGEGSSFAARTNDRALGVVDGYTYID